MLAKLGERNLWKLGVYFLYLCGQVLILGALMLTSTSIIAHTILMILTISLYFAVCFKDVVLFSLSRALIKLTPNPTSRIFLTRQIEPQAKRKKQSVIGRLKKIFKG
jgi:hypothetical protein